MLTSVSQIRSEGNLPNTVGEDKLSPHLDKAVIEAKRILTAEKYEEIEDSDSGDETRKICAIAEANLALSYAVTSLNIETSGEGIVRRLGFGENPSELLSQSEVDKLREYYRGIAMDLLEPFIPQKTNGISVDVMRGSEIKMFAL